MNCLYTSFLHVGQYTYPLSSWVLLSTCKLNSVFFSLYSVDWNRTQKQMLARSQVHQLEISFLHFETTIKVRFAFIMEVLDQRCSHCVGIVAEYDTSENSSKQFLQMQKNQLIERFERFCNTLPVLVFNIARYDVKFIKSFLLTVLVNKRNFDQIFIEKTNQFVWLKFGNVQLLNIFNFFAGVTNLVSFLKACRISETTEFFPCDNLNHYITWKTFLEQRNIPICRKCVSKKKSSHSKNSFCAGTETKTLFEHCRLRRKLSSLITTKLLICWSLDVLYLAWSKFACTFLQVHKNYAFTEIFKDLLSKIWKDVSWRTVQIVYRWNCCWRDSHLQFRNCLQIDCWSRC